MWLRATDAEYQNRIMVPKGTTPPQGAAVAASAAGAASEAVAAGAL